MSRDARGQGTGKPAVDPWTESNVCRCNVVCQMQISFIFAPVRPSSSPYFRPWPTCASHFFGVHSRQQRTEKLTVYHQQQNEGERQFSAEWNHWMAFGPTVEELALPCLASLAIMIASFGVHSFNRSMQLATLVSVCPYLCANRPPSLCHPHHCSRMPVCVYLCVQLVIAISYNYNCKQSLN